MLWGLIDLWLFLIGMMLLGELARKEGLFDWLAGHGARWANGSGVRLFDLTFLVAIPVTVFLSNDATAVVMTPAILTMTERVGICEPLPYLLIAAFVANAGSFVLPIANPANLVIYGQHLPVLMDWLRAFSLPSLGALLATWAALRFGTRRVLAHPIARNLPQPDLSASGRVTLIALGGTAMVMVMASAAGLPLGPPSALTGLVTAATVLGFRDRAGWMALLGHIAWGILGLVGLLFLVVYGLDRLGVIAILGHWLAALAGWPPLVSGMGAGMLVGFASNIVNNLPIGLIAGTAASAAGSPPGLTQALVIGTDLGPNLSVTGSLATLFWLNALKRARIRISPWSFLFYGVLVTPPALLLALAILGATGLAETP